MSFPRGKPIAGSKLVSGHPTAEIEHPGVLVLALVFGWLAASTARGVEIPSLERAAAALQASTVTVRVAAASAREDAGDEAASADRAGDDGRPPRSVTVCSGVSLGGGLVVTYVDLAPDSTVRITIPGGDQAEAKLRVVDHISGLVLLETDKRDIPALEMADKLPAVGGWVLSAAAWGAEKPVVSQGILSGKDRAIPGANFPPLLQCDLRTAETSSGAAVVSRQGKLIGVIVATDAPAQQHGWTYAVGVQHVRRLVRARVPGKVIVLRRRRPIAGLELAAGDEPGSVVVERVADGGPAQHAGIRVGDAVLEAEGIKIRSVYQVVQPLLQKQPGDKMTFLIQRGDRRQTVEVVLGGGVELADAPRLSGAAALVERRIQIGEASFRRFDAQNAAASGPSATGPAVDAPADANVRLLQKAIDGYGVALARLQEELRRRDKERAENEDLIQSLRAEIAKLKKQLEDAR